MGEVWWHPAHADRLALLHDLRALGRHDAVIHDEADEVAAHVALLHVLERPAADEVLLVPLGEPAHVRLEDVRLGVRVLPGPGAADEGLAERRDVEDADVLVDVLRLSLRVAVGMGTAPGARPHDLRAEVLVAVVHGRALPRLLRAAGEEAE